MTRNKLDMPGQPPAGRPEPGGTACLRRDLALKAEASEAPAGRKAVGDRFSAVFYPNPNPNPSPDPKPNPHPRPSLNPNPGPFRQGASPLGDRLRAVLHGGPRLVTREISLAGKEQVSWGRG